MPSTFLDLNCHVVFSTKHRQPWIADVWRSELHGYLGGTLSGLGVAPLAIGGIDDHVHLLVGLRGKHALSDVMREIKKASTSWVRSHHRLPSFAWQEGYAAFSVSASYRNQIASYIANQEEHHRKVSSRDELILMLQEAGVAFADSFLE